MTIFKRMETFSTIYTPIMLQLLVSILICWIYLIYLSIEHNKTHVKQKYESYIIDIIIKHAYVG